jgi:DNA-binding GntR family transcriptional regulator
MSPDDSSVLSDRVQQLLLGPIDSFEKLEVLTALHGSGTPLKPDALESLVGSPIHVLSTALDELVADGLVERRSDGALRIAPACDRAVLDELADAWVNARVAVVEMMTAHAVRRIRASAARAFADAFQLGRPNKDTREGDG